MFHALLQPDTYYSVHTHEDLNAGQPYEGEEDIGGEFIPAEADLRLAWVARIGLASCVLLWGCA